MDTQAFVILIICWVTIGWFVAKAAVYSGDPEVPGPKEIEGQLLFIIICIVWPLWLLTLLWEILARKN